MAMLADDIRNGPRDWEAYRAHCRLIEAVLRAKPYPTEAAGAFISPGASPEYEPRPEPIVNGRRWFNIRLTRQPNCTPGVCLCPNGSRNPSWQRAVDNHLDRELYGSNQARHVVQRLRTLLAALTWRERLVLDLCVTQGMSYREAAEWRPDSLLAIGPLGKLMRVPGLGLGLAKSQVGNVHAAALGKLESWLWHPDGTPCFGEHDHA